MWSSSEGTDITGCGSGIGDSVRRKGVQTSSPCGNTQSGIEDQEIQDWEEDDKEDSTGHQQRAKGSRYEAHQVEEEGTMMAAKKKQTVQGGSAKRARRQARIDAAK